MDKQIAELKDQLEDLTKQLSEAQKGNKTMMAAAAAIFVALVVSHAVVQFAL